MDEEEKIPAGNDPLPELRENEGKNLILERDGHKYERLPIKTHVITDKDNICDVAQKYAKPYLQPDDILFISEKAVACTQGRAIPLDQIKPRKLAVFLSSHVVKTKH
ncbi:MAG: coenzyme F420-0:L-glutamate ligase, partial [Clostridia bacterium]|nr:coenzyme F420-0:L-glutamate ligase [Clostridia bacterium]